MHDIQIIINSSSIASRYQEMQQYQTQIAQTHMALRLSDDVELKRTQIQETQQRQEAKAITDTEEHLRYWKKDNFEKRKDIQLAKKTQRKKGDIMISEHIIDILA